MLIGSCDLTTFVQRKLTTYKYAALGFVTILFHNTWSETVLDIEFLNDNCLQLPSYTQLSIYIQTFNSSICI